MKLTPELKMKIDGHFKNLTSEEFIKQLEEVSKMRTLEEVIPIIKMELKKGSKRYLKGNEDKPYVKLEDLDFAWWRKEDLDLEEHKRTMVRMTDEDAFSETYFILEPKY